MGFFPPFFQFEIETAVIMCKLKGLYLHEIWGNKHNLGEAFLLMETLWWVLEINTHQECEMISSFRKLCTKIMTIPHFQESIVKSDDTLQSFQTIGVHED